MKGLIPYVLLAALSGSGIAGYNFLEQDWHKQAVENGCGNYDIKTGDWTWRVKR